MATILLVDDDERVRDVLREVLEVAGHEVTVAGEGKTALAEYGKSPADVVITDLVMPDFEGLQFIQALCRTYPEVKIIAMSGGGTFDNPNYLKLARRFGARYTLTKPFSFDELLDTVDLTLALRDG